MRQTFDIEAIIFKLLSTANLGITGDIYVGYDRDLNSSKEDVVINTITLTQDYLPQLATSNVNIYVPDKVVKINGKDQHKADRIRLKELSRKVIDTLNNAIITGLIWKIEYQYVVNVQDVHQHFVNLRLSWNIQNEE